MVYRVILNKLFRTILKVAFYCEYRLQILHLFFKFLFEWIIILFRSDYGLNQCYCWCFFCICFCMFVCFFIVVLPDSKTSSYFAFFKPKTRQGN